MKKCKFCRTELEEGVTLCPECGADNALPEAPENQIDEKTYAGEIVTDAGEVSEIPEMSAMDEAAQMPAAEENAPVQIQEGMKVTPGKIALLVGAIVVVLALIVAMLAGSLSGAPAETEPPVIETEAATEPVATIPADGDPNDETCKGTYTVSDEEAKAAAEVVVAQIGEHTLTNGQLQVLYWMQVQDFLSSEYGSYMMYYGMLDYTKPLDTQTSVMAENCTWQQFFLKEALNTWRSYCALAEQAKASGMEMPQEQQDYLDGIVENLEANAQYYGLESVDELLRVNIGAGASVEDYQWYQELLMWGNLYYDTASADFAYTQEELDAFFADHEEQYAESGVTRDGTYVDVRHILYMPEGGTTDESGATVYSEEEWAACEEKAAAVLKEWETGEKTEDSFAALANANSQDPGSNTNGGLYENVYVGQMVPEFENWCFDENRKTGDTGIVRTTYGYHVMYFVNSEPIWISYARQDKLLEDTNNMMDQLRNQYPMTVQYGDVVIGFVNLGQEKNARTLT